MHESEIMKRNETTEGCLDGKTIIRFTHSSSDGAGIENHLNYLNRELLNRNAMNIIQIYMDSTTSASTESISFGKGTLLKIPLPSLPCPEKNAHPLFFQKLTGRFYHLSLNPKVTMFSDSLKFLFYMTQLRIFGERKRKLYEKRFREVDHLDIVIQKIFTRSAVDLVVNHFAGGKDSLLLMQEAHSRLVPILIVNHFHNRWFNYIPIREQTHLASLTAGTSARDLPHYIQRNFINLSNGIDTRFFQRSLSTNPMECTKKYPVILLPARVEPAKGHLDILKALCILKKRRINAQLICVGRVDSKQFKEQCCKFAKEHTMQDQVEFTGQVDQTTLRQWYFIADIVVLPSYQEGSGRVLLESQAMQVPPIAYKTGGTPETIIDKETGILVDPGKIKKLSEKVELLLKDPALRQRMGNRGRLHVEKNFSLTALAQRHESVYYDLINLRRGCSVD
jgi:glycosyltransferase involved in cell wall biosynthesis